MMASRSLWNNENTEILIEAVRYVPFIYNPGDKSHKDAQKCANFWASLAQKINKDGIDGKFTTQI
jgi:hypothetical protein